MTSTESRLNRDLVRDNSHRSLRPDHMEDHFRRVNASGLSGLGFIKMLFESIDKLGDVEAVG